MLHERTPLQEALDAALVAAPGIDPRDAALATETAYGVARLRGRLEFLLRRRLQAPHKLPPVVWTTLMVAAYEMLFLDKTPAYAAVDWAVRAVKGVAPKLGGVANGVLRTLDRERDIAADKAFYLADASDRRTGLAAWYGVPPWLVAFLVESFQPASSDSFHRSEGVQDGERDGDGLPTAAAAVLQARLRRPPLGVRLNPRTLGAAYDDMNATLGNHPALLVKGPWGGALEPTATPGDAMGAIVRDLAPFPADQTASWRDLEAYGLLTRQSLASQLILSALAGEEGRAAPTPLWDACAGSGGKILALAERAVQPEGFFASDVHRGRLRRLPDETRRLGLPAIPICLANATAPPFRHGACRSILVDAPCSGLGVLSRRPDLAWNLTAAGVAALPALQRRMLDATFAALPSGGRLIYITCTVTPRENQLGVCDFLQAQGASARLCVETTTDPALGLQESFYGVLLEKTM